MYKVKLILEESDKGVIIETFNCSTITDLIRELDIRFFGQRYTVLEITQQKKRH